MHGLLISSDIVSFIGRPVKRISCEHGHTPLRAALCGRESAEETRRRILDGVYDRLRAAPGQPVSVEAIARAAGVARSTVYVVFGSRAGLFDAFSADLLERGGFHRVLDAIADPDPRVTVREGIAGGVHTFAAHRDVFRALVSMAALDPDAVGGAMQRSDAAARQGHAVAGPAAGEGRRSSAPASRPGARPIGSGS